MKITRELRLRLYLRRVLARFCTGADDHDCIHCRKCREMEDRLTVGLIAFFARTRRALEEPR